MSPGRAVIRLNSGTFQAKLCTIAAGGLGWLASAAPTAGAALAGWAACAVAIGAAFRCWLAGFTFTTSGVTMRGFLGNRSAGWDEVGGFSVRQQWAGVQNVVIDLLDGRTFKSLAICCQARDAEAVLRRLRMARNDATRGHAGMAKRI